MSRREDIRRRLGEPCPLPEGTRLRLIEMPDDPRPIRRCATGTVTGGNGAQIWVAWDDGHNLALLVGKDKWEIVR